MQIDLPDSSVDVAALVMQSLARLWATALQACRVKNTVCPKRDRS